MKPTITITTILLFIISLYSGSNITAQDHCKQLVLVKHYMAAASRNDTKTMYGLMSKKYRTEEQANNKSFTKCIQDGLLQLKTYKIDSVRYLKKKTHIIVVARFIYNESKKKYEKNERMQFTLLKENDTWFIVDLR